MAILKVVRYLRAYVRSSMNFPPLDIIMLLSALKLFLSSIIATGFKMRVQRGALVMPTYCSVSKAVLYNALK